MGDWVTYRYINRLRDNTPDNVLNLLEKAYKEKTYKEDEPDLFKGENEFLNHLRVLYFDREEKIIVLYGYSKYFRERKALESFVEWISPYIHIYDVSEYHGIVYGSDYAGSPPILIYGNELRDLDYVQRYHDEEHYQQCDYAKRIIRPSLKRAQSLEDLLICADEFLKYLENNSRKKLRMSPQTRKLILLVGELKESQNQQIEIV